MGVPKRKVSKARQGERRAHLAISAPPLVECDHCHELKRAHHVCPTCGWYARPRGGGDRAGRPGRRPALSADAHRGRRDGRRPRPSRDRPRRTSTTQSTNADEVSLVGDVPRLEREVAEYGKGRPANVRFVDAPEVVGMGEHPATAIRTKRRSSIRVATDLVRDGDADAVVSAGSTGATMAAAVLRLGRIEGIDRPALPAHMVTATGPVMLLDVGANVDSDPEHLVQFAAMGAIFAEHVLHVRNPRIGLLNIGEEVEKGDELAREAHAKLAALDLHFVGNIEAHDMIAHRADVVVCDGFVGNVVIKFFEGITSFIFRALREDLQQGPIAPVALLALQAGLRPDEGALRLRALRRRAAARREGGEHRHPRPRQGPHDRARPARRVGVGRGRRARPDRPVDARAPGARPSRRPLAHRGPPAPGARLACRRPADARDGAAAPGMLARRLALLALFEDEFRPGSADAALERLATEREVPTRCASTPRGSSTGSAATVPIWTAGSPPKAPLIPVPELGRVERTILRSALYEVLYSAATPSGETMRDAVSLARIYAGDAARRLVNGVLGSVSRSPGGGA